MVNIDTKNRTAIGAHKRMTIQDNLITGKSSQNGIAINNAEDVKLINNEITECQPGILIQYTRRIEIISNPKIKVELGKGVSEVNISENTP